MKITIKEIKEKNNDDLLKLILQKNDKLENKIYYKIYEDNMMYQKELARSMLGENSYNFIDIENNYNSFYLVLTDWEQLDENIGTSYLSDEELKLYKKIKKMKVYYNNCNYGSNKYWDWYNLIEYNYKELLNLIENDLHKLEDVNDKDILNYLIDYDDYDDCYIKNFEDLQLYEFVPGHEVTV